MRWFSRKDPEKITLGDLLGSLRVPTLKICLVSGLEIPRYERLKGKLQSLFDAIEQYHAVERVEDLPMDTVLHPEVVRSYHKLERWYNFRWSTPLR